MNMFENAPCLNCDEAPGVSRGLCSTCYSSARRHDELGEWPTQKFLDDPDAHIRWAFGHYPDLVGDIALEYGYRVDKITY